MRNLQPFCPVDIRVLPALEGQEAIRAMLPQGGCRLLVMAPRFLCGELALAAFWTALQGDGHSVHLVTDIPSNPSLEDLVGLLAIMRQKEFSPQALLAIGGGSCIDLAKGFSAFWHMPQALGRSVEALREAIAARAYDAPDNPFVDILAMPTTAGTGSEVTHWATLWDESKRSKLSIDCQRLFPKGAVLVTEWTAGMPPALTLSTGLDALSHGMEAYWAKASTPLSQALALSAVDKVRRFLPQALARPGDLDYRQEMCTASLLAGLAFSITRTTACHSLSYPLTMLHGVPHGFAAAVTLVPVMQRNRAAVPGIATLEGLFAPDGGLLPWLQQTCDGVQTLHLAAFGIGLEHLEAIADQAFTAGRMDNNPVLFTRQDVLDILRQVM